MDRVRGQSGLVRRLPLADVGICVRVLLRRERELGRADRELDLPHHRAGRHRLFLLYDWAMRRLQGVLNVYVRRLRRGKGAAKRPSSPERRVEDVFGLEDRSEDRKEGASAAQGAAERPARGGRTRNGRETG